MNTLLKKINNQAELYASNHKNEYLKESILNSTCYGMLMWELYDRISKKYENNTNKEVFNFFNECKKEIDKILTKSLSLQGNVSYAYYVNKTLDFDEEIDKLSPELNKLIAEIDKYENNNNK